MIFIPYPDEMERIHQIQRYQGTDYALIRLTFTMIDKNNLDAGGLLRDLLLQEGIVDYARLAHGGENGIDRRALLLLEEGLIRVGGIAAAFGAGLGFAAGFGGLGPGLRLAGAAGAQAPPGAEYAVHQTFPIVVVAHNVLLSGV